MKKAAATVLAVSFLFTASLPLAGKSVSAAQAVVENSWKTAKITDVIDRNNYILEDGSLWTTSVDGPVLEHLNLVGITAGEGSSHYGWTGEGQSLSWSTVTGGAVMPAQSAGISEISGEGLVIKKDGSVLIGGKTVEGLSNVVDGDKLEEQFSVITNSGDVWYSSGYNGSKPRMVGHVDHAVELRMSTAYAAVLQKSGRVIMLDLLTDEDPVEVGQDINTIVWKKGTHVLYAVHQDGSVWTYDRMAGYKPVQLSGISDAVKLVNSPDELFVQLRDGSWTGYQNGKSTPLNVPVLNSVSLMSSAANAAVGDTIHLQVQETYSNGYRLVRDSEAGEIIVDQTEVAELQEPGTLKVRGIGNTAVNLQTGGLASSVTLSVTTVQPLTGAAMLKGKAYLPLQPVFKSLGGTVTVAGQQFTIKLGKDTIVLKKGSAEALLNGKPVTMKGTLQTAGGQAVFPGSLISDLKKGTLQWDTKLQQAILNIGGSKLIIESPATVKIKKSIELGNLVNLIGKSYWVNNYYNAGERFEKVTIQDIEVSYDAIGVSSFSVVFRNPGGKIYKTPSQIGASRIPDMLSDSDQFLTYNPYQKYNWSTAAWNSIKNNEVDFGMNTTQAEFAWGRPTSISKESGVEVWVYGDKSFYFKALVFEGGKVTEILL
ncbi:stalk domain-containing protein [Paenibacillus terreus]|uniref:Stalk domain-containing protein n=1 Tax=Paenibacillus terreus TaxID=1387834 RepID=A0ABV5BAB7_9BACL